MLPQFFFLPTVSHVPHHSHATMEPVIEKSDFSGASVTKERASQQDSSEKIGSSNSIAEKKLVRKCDIHVLPAISLLFILTFLDRINIGNARIQGLEKDLNMKGHDFNIALLVFFIPYIIFEVPSNILIRRIAPSTWLALIMICWGMSRLQVYFSDSQLIKTSRCCYSLHGTHPKFCGSGSMPSASRTFRGRLFPRYHIFWKVFLRNAVLI